MSSLIFLNTFIITILSSLLGISSNSLSLNGIAMALVISFHWLFGNLPSCALSRPMSSPPPCDPFTTTTITKATTKPSPFLWSIYSLEHAQIPSVQPPKGRWVFLSLYPCQKPSAEQSLAVARAVGGQLSRVHTTAGTTVMWAGEGQGWLFHAHAMLVWCSDYEAQLLDVD